MPGFGTTDRTYRNALKLMEGLGVTVREIPIRDACLQHFRDIGLPESDRSAAYENAQARERTQILMDVANMEDGMVIGTGDLSELALGWATYNGDQMSMYGVNASVPKTLVRHLVRWAADTERDGATRATLLDIIDTPVSPELLPADREGNIAQKTEDLVGPYELHDFFLYNFVPAGFRPAKIAFLAEQAFAGSYDRETIVSGSGSSSAASSRSSSSARRCPTARRWVPSRSRRAATGACPPTPRRRCGSASWRNSERARRQ